VGELTGPVFTSEADIRKRQNHYERLYACLSDLEEFQKLNKGPDSPIRELAELKPVVEWFILFTGTPQNSLLPNLGVLSRSGLDVLKDFLGNERQLVDLQYSPDPAVKRLRSAGLPPPRGFIFVRFFSDRDHLPNSLKAAFTDEATAGVTLPGGRYIAILKRGTLTGAERSLEEREIPKTLSHELVHAYINGRFPATKRSLPRWFQEGSAIYLSGGGRPDQEVQVSPAGSTVDLPPFLTQAVKTQNPFKGELSHGIVEKDIHEGVQVGRGAAAGTRGFHRRGGAGVGGQPQRAAPLAAGDSPGARQRVSRARKATLGRRPHR
jgi:hypothetical protein